MTYKYCDIILRLGEESYQYARYIKKSKVHCYMGCMKEAPLNPSNGLEFSGLTCSAKQV